MNIDLPGSGNPAGYARLATKWEMSKDGLTWTFWIRKGIQFHGGYGELTAEDVKYSLQRVIDPKSHCWPVILHAKTDKER